MREKVHGQSGGEVVTDIIFFYGDGYRLAMNANFTSQIDD